MQQLNIREALLEDREDIRSILLEFHKVSPYKDIIVDTDKSTVFIENSINNKDILTLVAYADKDIIGILIGTIQEFPFSKAKSSLECIWYIKKEYRGHTVGKDLYILYEKWAIKNNVDVITTTSPIEHKSLKDWYIYIGYKPIEEVYMYYNKDKDNGRRSISS